MQCICSMLHAQSLLDSKCLPSSSIHITFKSPRDHTRDAMAEPSVSKQLVIPLLVEEKLVVSTQSGVDLAVTVKVRCMVPATMTVMQE